jgi:hypothetical protein
VRHMVDGIPPADGVRDQAHRDAISPSGEVLFNGQPQGVREALQAFLTAYGSQESSTAGLDKAAAMARDALRGWVPMPADSRRKNPADDGPTAGQGTLNL